MNKSISIYIYSRSNRTLSIHFNQQYEIMDGSAKGKTALNRQKNCASHLPKENESDYYLRMGTESQLLIFLSDFDTNG